eukprot:m.4004 g.4004  ORF g.4004 m.4004 type:complete len:225 (-) comp4383_c0_seq2:326-1000(-)
MAADPQLQRLINRIGEASQQFTALASKTEASMTELKASHEQTMAQDKENHKKLKTKLASLQQQSELSQEVTQQHQKQYDALQAEIQRAEKAAKAFSASFQDMEQQVVSLQEKKDAATLEYASERERVEAANTRLCHGLGWYSARLGFSIVPKQANVIALSFKYIDPKDQDKEYSLELHLQEDDSYQLRKTTPQIELQSAIEELNTTNNLSKFVVTARNTFKALN